MARGRQSGHRVTDVYFNDADRRTAWDAVQTFNKLIPQLRHFARAVTGNPKMEIRATSGAPSTLGNVIHLRPPLGLGKNPKHERAKCGMRSDNTRRQLCRACEVREVIDFYLFHEIGHVAFGTQVPTSHSDIKLAQSYIDEWHPRDACMHGHVLTYQASRAADPKVLGNILNPYLAMLINCLEDVRVNSRTFDARPGLRTVFDINIEEIMTNGVEIGLEKTRSWIEAPLDSQFMIGLFVLGSGHSVEGRLDSSVVEALTDSTIIELFGRAAYASDVHEIFELSLEVFRRAQYLRFLVVDKCVPEVSPAPDDDDKVTSAEDESVTLSDSGDTGDRSSDTANGPTDTGDGTSGDSAERETSSGPSPAADNSVDDVSSDKTEQDGSGGSDSDDSANPQDNPEERAASTAAGDDETSGGPGDDDDGDDNLDDIISGVGDSNIPDDDDDDDDAHEPSGSDGHDGQSCDGDIDPSEDEPLDNAPPRVAENPWDVVPDDGDDDSEPFDGPSVDAAGTESGTLGHGTPDDAERAIGRFLMHGNDDQDGLLQRIADGDLEGILGQDSDEDKELVGDVANLLKIALSQVQFFDDASRDVAGVEIVDYPNNAIDWEAYYTPDMFSAPEMLVGKTILHGRRVFDDNERGKHLTNLKSGRVNTRVLGRRAPVGDPRLFQKKVVPGKRSYFVVIGVDCSGSTTQYERNTKIKRAAMAQGEVLSRLGIQWAGYGHTAYTQPISKFASSRYIVSRDSYYVYILPFKTAEEPWNAQAKTKLANIMPVSDNLDGHTLEYYRKVAEKSNATDKIIIYYTDGEMPAANYTEEREILVREVQYCKKNNITLLGVGINTDSPSYYGMDTVRIDRDEDISLVMEQLDRQLTRKR